MNHDFPSGDGKSSAEDPFISLDPRYPDEIASQEKSASILRANFAFYKDFSQRAKCDDHARGRLGATQNNNAPSVGSGRGLEGRL
ncbi:hypothetical protein, partial [Crenobacter luteus]|uniref:hypothetical protein n=1 Tax=Crenobacter luteus TaxID=1452487 RepID=UPI001E34F5C9